MSTKEEWEMTIAMVNTAVSTVLKENPKMNEFKWSKAIRGFDRSEDFPLSSDEIWVWIDGKKEHSFSTSDGVKFPRTLAVFSKRQIETLSGKEIYSFAKCKMEQALICIKEFIAEKKGVSHV